MELSLHVDELLPQTLILRLSLLIGSKELVLHGSPELVGLMLILGAKAIHASVQLGIGLHQSLQRVCIGLMSHGSGRVSGKGWACVGDK